MSTAIDPILVPPLRLGRLLRERREADGRTIEDLAAASGGTVSVATLEDLEAGRADVADDDLPRLVALYGVDVGRLVPERMQLVIDLDAGRLSLGEGPDGAEGTIGASDPEQVLVRYLALLYATRGMPVGTPLPLRRLDLDVLAVALGMRTDEVQDRLRHLMLRPGEELHTTVRRVRRRVVVPLVGVLVGVTAMGTLLMVRSEERAPSLGGVVEPAAAVSTHPDGDRVAEAPGDERGDDGAETIPTEIGDAVIAERDPVTGEVTQRVRGD